MTKDARIFVAGHRGMVGSAIVRCLKDKGYSNIVTRTRDELDLTCQHAVREFFHNENIDQVYLAAAKVGGIHANSAYPAEFIYQNLMIEANVIHQAYKAGTQKLLFLGSSCIYPRLAEQPITEESLLNGKLEPTNEPYAIAKIAGIKLCETYNRQYGTDYRSVMPTNLYGPGDNYHPENSHVIPGLIRRLHAAKVANADEVVIWGTGLPRREFLYVDDMASACVHVMEVDRDIYQATIEAGISHVNVGIGEDITIRELGESIKRIVGFRGKLKFDTTKPDGTPRKLLKLDRLTKIGWKAKIDLEEGLSLAYNDFLKVSNVLLHD